MPRGLGLLTQPLFLSGNRKYPLSYTFFFFSKFFRNQNSLVHICYGLDVLTDWTYLVLRVMQKGIKEINLGNVSQQNNSPKGKRSKDLGNNRKDRRHRGNEERGLAG